MNESEKPDISLLLDWLEGRLDADQARQLEERIERGGAEMQTEIAWLRDFLETAEAARRTTPPSAVRADLVRSFETFARDRRPPGLFARLAAALTFDSAAAPAPAGLRSTRTQGRQRQLVYEADPAEIALNIFPNSHNERVTISGQIYPKQARPIIPFSVQILEVDGATEQGLTTADDLGEFVLEDIAEGRYSILISSDGFEIALPEIHIRR